MSKTGAERYLADRMKDPEYAKAYSEAQKAMSNEPIIATIWEQCAQHKEAGGVVERRNLNGWWEEDTDSPDMMRRRPGFPGDMWLSRRLVPIPTPEPEVPESLAESVLGLRIAVRHLLAEIARVVVRHAPAAWRRGPLDALTRYTTATSGLEDDLEELQRRGDR